jgi:hypothetical protein
VSFHASDEQLLAPMARQGIVPGAAFFRGIGHGHTAS